MEPWRFSRLMVGDSHHFEEELDPDLDPDPQSEKLDPDLDPHESDADPQSCFFLYFKLTRIRSASKASIKPTNIY